MFDALIESRSVHSHSMGNPALAVIAHGMIIIAAIQLTRHPGRVSGVAPDAVLMPVYHTAPPAMPQTAPASAMRQSAAVVPSLVAVPPIRVPSSLPVPDRSQHFDARRFDGGSGHPGVGDFTPPTVADSAGYTIAQVDEPAQYLGGPEPVYPPALRQVGIGGSVTLGYVVAADGTVEAGSVVVLSSTNPQFDAPATEAIRRARFHPARLHGKAVRQLVEQVVRFVVR